MVYGLVAIGIVLIFRASGVINFAQGQFGALGASIMAVLFVNNGMVVLGRASRSRSPPAPSSEA